MPRAPVSWKVFFFFISFLSVCWILLYIVVYCCISWLLALRRNVLSKEDYPKKPPADKVVLSLKFQGVWYMWRLSTTLKQHRSLLVRMISSIAPQDPNEKVFQTGTRAPRKIEHIRHVGQAWAHWVNVQLNPKHGDKTTTEHGREHASSNLLSYIPMVCSLYA